MKNSDCVQTTTLCAFHVRSLQVIVRSENLPETKTLSANVSEDDMTRR